MEPYPLLTGLVVSRRRGLVILWSEVRTFAAATREVALREPREAVEQHRADGHDVWLARDVLDKQVVDTDGRRVVRVNDLQLANSGPNLLLVGADIGVRGILRRLGLEPLGKSLARLLRRELPIARVSWDAVQQFSAPTDDRPAAEDAVHLRISGSPTA